MEVRSEELRVRSRARVRREVSALVPCCFHLSQPTSHDRCAKSLQGESAVALTARAAEAHRHVVIAPRDWRLPGCQAQSGRATHVNTAARLVLHQHHSAGPASHPLSGAYNLAKTWHFSRSWCGISGSSGRLLRVALRGMYCSRGSRQLH